MQNNRLPKLAHLCYPKGYQRCGKTNIQTDWQVLKLPDIILVLKHQIHSCRKEEEETKMKLAQSNTGALCCRHTSHRNFNYHSPNCHKNLTFNWIKICQQNIYACSNVSDNICFWSLVQLHSYSDKKRGYWKNRPCKNGINTINVDRFLEPSFSSLMLLTHLGIGCQVTTQHKTVTQSLVRQCIFVGWYNTCHSPPHNLLHTEFLLSGHYINWPP